MKFAYRLGKSIIFVLIASMFLILIAGCDSKTSGDTKTGETNAPDKAEVDETAKVAKQYVADYLPDMKFDGYEFRIVSPNGGIFVDYLEFWADAEEENGDVLNDALYKRNRIIEERYDIKIKQIGVDDWPQLLPLFKKSVAGGTDDFDLCMLISREAWSTGLTGAIMAMSNLPYQDLTQPWYVKYVNDQLSINGKYYFAYSDECLNMLFQTVCVMFNKKIAADLEIENLYQLVKDGKWTLDKFFDIARTATKDLDGDGKMTQNDRYGIMSRTTLPYACYWMSSGLKTVGKDENDLLVFTGLNEKVIDVLSKAYQNLFGGSPIAFGFAWGDDDARHAMFANDQGLFHADIVGDIVILRAMETDFGIIPFPKYDEKQEKYYSRIIDGWINCVPNTAPNVERTSIIMEALAVESKNYTMPAYFETTLRTKHARDNESQDMIALVAETRTLDLATFLDSIINTYDNVFLAKKGDNFVSAIEKNLPTIEKALNKANEAALALELD